MRGSGWDEIDEIVDVDDPEDLEEGDEFDDPDDDPELIPAGFEASAVMVPPGIPPTPRPFNQPAMVPPAPPPVQPPESAEDTHSRYERRLPPDIQVFDKQSYDQLRGFVEGRSDREKWKLALFRQVSENGKSKWSYIERIALPDGILEDFVRETYGGGEFRWQLALAHRFVGRKDLPPSMQDIPLEGTLSIDAPPKLAADRGDSSAVEAIKAAQSESQKVMEMLVRNMEKQIERAQTGSHSNTEALVSMSNVMLQGLQAQMTMQANAANQQLQAAQAAATQQQNFMMMLMERSRDEANARGAEKDKMWDRMLELVMAATGQSGEPKSTLQLAVEGFKAAADMFKSNPQVGQLPPPGAGAPAPQPTPQPVPQPAPEQEGPEKMWALYITNVVSQCYNLYKVSTPPQIAAQVVANLGSDEDNERLMNMNEAEVLALINDAHKQYIGGEAPAGLVGWVKQVYAVLHAPDEDEEEEAAAARPVEVRTLPAQPTGGPVNAPSESGGPVEPPRSPSEQ